MVYVRAADYPKVIRDRQVLQTLVQYHYTVIEDAQRSMSRAHEHRKHLQALIKGSQHTDGVKNEDRILYCLAIKRESI